MSSPEATAEAPAVEAPWSRPKEYPIHPLCKLVPEMLPTDFQQMELTVRKYGFKEPAILAKIGRHHVIIEGRTRQKLLLKLYDEGVYNDESGKPITLDFHDMGAMTDKEVFDLVDSKSSRRNLSKTQAMARAIVFHFEEKKILREAGTPMEVKGNEAEFIMDRYKLRNRMMASNLLMLYRRRQALFMAVYAGELPLPKAMNQLHEELEAKKAKSGEKGEEVEKEEGKLYDALSNEVPPHLVKVFEDADKFKTLSSQLRKLNTLINELAGSAAGKLLNAASIVSQIGAASTAISRSAPYCVCPHCNGAKCKKCSKYGFMSKLQHTAFLSHSTDEGVDSPKDEAETTEKTKRGKKSESEAPVEVPADAGTAA